MRAHKPEDANISTTMRVKSNSVILELQQWRKCCEMNYVEASVIEKCVEDQMNEEDGLFRMNRSPKESFEVVQGRRGLYRS